MMKITVFYLHVIYFCVEIQVRIQDLVKGQRPKVANVVESSHASEVN